MAGVGPDAGVVVMAGISVGMISPAVAESPIISTPVTAVTISNIATNVGLLCKILYHFPIKSRIYTTFTTPLSVRYSLVCARHAANRLQHRPHVAAAVESAQSNVRPIIHANILDGPEPMGSVGLALN
jgi:hypothetical protein